MEFGGLRQCARSADQGQLATGNLKGIGNWEFAQDHGIGEINFHSNADMTTKRKRR